MSLCYFTCLTTRLAPQIFFLYYNLVSISLRNGLSKHSFVKQRIKEFNTKSKSTLRVLFLQGEEKNSPY